MSKMFTNYDNPIVTNPCKPCFSYCNTKQVIKPLIDIKGKILGIQAKHTLPFNLYFHLENFNSYENTELSHKLASGMTTLEILTLNGKSVLKQEYYTIEILNQYTNDLCIPISQLEAEQLKKETYVMKLDLSTDSNYYRLFSEKDGYLVIR